MTDANEEKNERARVEFVRQALLQKAQKVRWFRGASSAARSAALLTLRRAISGTTMSSSPSCRRPTIMRRSGAGARSAARLSVGMAGGHGSGCVRRYAALAKSVSFIEEGNASRALLSATFTFDWKRSTESRQALRQRRKALVV